MVEKRFCGIGEIYQYVKNNDLRADKIGQMYRVTELLNCYAAEINYTNYHDSFASKARLGL
jgi:hypothetical protein